MKSLTAVVALAVLGLTLLDTARTNAPADELITAQTRGDTGSVRQLLDGIRGANAIQCELLLQAFNGWTTNVPDRDSAAWSVTQLLRRRVTDAAEIAWLGEQVRSTDRCAARAAARMLGRSPSPAARTFLVGALGDANAQVRQLAAIGIGWRSDSTVNSRLVTLLGDGNAEVRAAAAWALGAVH
jgi:hypothetical protein